MFGFTCVSQFLICDPFNFEFSIRINIRMVEIITFLWTRSKWNSLLRSTVLRSFKVGSTVVLRLPTLNLQTKMYRNQDIYNGISLATCGSVELSCLKYERVPPNNVLREVWDVTEVWKCFVEWDNVSGQCPLAQPLHQNWNEHVKELRQ